MKKLLSLLFLIVMTISMTIPISAESASTWDTGAEYEGVNGWTAHGSHNPTGEP